MTKWLLAFAPPVNTGFDFAHETLADVTAFSRSLS